jgi:glycosyltransferase involved in cell wall biosynthesis
MTFVTASVSRNAGGLFESVRRLAQSIQTNGDRIQVLGVRDKHTVVDVENWMPLAVQVYPVRGPERFNFAPGLARALSECGADILHSHAIWNYTSVAVSNWHRRTRRPYVVHPHGMLDPWAVQHSNLKKKLAGAIYENNHLQNAACIRALCESEAQSIRNYGLKNPICIIPNGIDLPQPGNAGPALCAEPLQSIKSGGRKILLYLGRIHTKKGLANLLRAWQAMQTAESPDRADWVLAIAGWDEKGHEAELKHLATEIGLSWLDVRENHQDQQGLLSTSSVVFVGPQFNDGKAASYDLSDAFILPSFSEGLPMTVLEAWSYGKPALITPECNLPEGYAADAALKILPNVAAIEQGISALMEMSETERRAMGARGQKLVAERFTWPTIARDLAGVSAWLLGQGPMPACVRLS